MSGEPRYWDTFGAHPESGGTRFAVWAPNARRVQVAGDFNDWDPNRAAELNRDDWTGCWYGFAEGAGQWDRYKYRVLGADGVWRLKADPVAFHSETAPASASRIFASSYEWQDADWLKVRREASGGPASQPMSVYEVHLPSWRRGRTYWDLASELVDHVQRHGFTHVEFLPVMEHPYGGSWGYQTTGFFAATSRLGHPDDLRYLVDRLHQAGIGVLFDWVPAHFARDEWALARFDGTAMYEHPDPRRGEHPDWGSLVFDFARWEVRDFLIASALYWIEEFHADGLRVDAVSSMLHLDYSRGPGQWEPNMFGGTENLDATSLLRSLNEAIHSRHPGVVTIAEESAAWPGVTRPTSEGGLGFDLKWNMGWMNDTLRYVVRDPVHRSHHHSDLTQPSTYAFSENYLLPLSHDEVVHGKQSLASKQPGTREDQVGGLRGLLAYQWAFPGKKLLFMGGEFGQRAEWSEERGLDWPADDSEDGGLTRLLADVNARYRETPALWTRDADPHATYWLTSDAGANLLAFARFGNYDDGSALVCVANFSGGQLRDHRIAMPWPGTWREVLNTDATIYGGSGSGNLGAVVAAADPSSGEGVSARVTVGARSVVWLAGRHLGVGGDASDGSG
ncbi:1,4-alpha-glucan branching protein GlgB [Catenulispora rubra]|uniref:1,4-alpha-glucan branching protein GlgB n=1 Tax=Catenulispora rubra TaxID=280293 RepID=UPI00189215B0|nr:1,4-alpha-glucan branching protein GlgB [Catenulispora rubra]